MFRKLVVQYTIKIKIKKWNVLWFCRAADTFPAPRGWFSMRRQISSTTHILGSFKPQIGVVRVSQRTQPSLRLRSLIRSSKVWHLDIFDRHLVPVFPCCIRVEKDVLKFNDKYWAESWSYWIRSTDWVCQF